MTTYKETLLFVTSVVIASLGCALRHKAPIETKPAIVMVAFGTSVPEARKVYDYIDAKVKERYADHDVRWAFTSEFIRAKLKRQGMITKSPQETAADLIGEGFTTAVFQSLHVAPGQEFAEINAINNLGLNIAVGKALLSRDTDIEKVIDALGRDIKANSTNVIACHGNEHHPEFNKQLLVLAQQIESRYANVFVCSVAGQPGIDKLKTASLRAKETGAVNFVPLMIVAGNHIMNDVIGDEADTWKHIVGAAETACAKPLGYNDQIIDIYLDHLHEALQDVNCDGNNHL
jgi:sirohydrochlorin cobaltochelatase